MESEGTKEAKLKIAQSNVAVEAQALPACDDRLAMLATLCNRFQVDILYLFGSRSDEVYRWLTGAEPALAPGPSDVDVGVKPHRGVHMWVHDKVDLAIALEDWLGVNRVDLVSLDDADAFLAAEIIRGARVYERDGYEADEYDLYVLRRAGDLAPLERERMAMILGKRS